MLKVLLSNLFLIITDCGSADEGEDGHVEALYQGGGTAKMALVQNDLCKMLTFLCHGMIEALCCVAALISISIDSILFSQ